ncbi:anthocyanidin 3-O-glucosyltransferase 2-like [Mangifera indica]|uniref:anthocyanidin 3-O-glucosyltransferase 2-like n=1 Tax=Mangifera indica TaxID=29780 RepID=UPI001CF9BA7A|nr:anthocyanidin 3-O-glucosyltransferase 2-like [Mangifera indica]
MKKIAELVLIPAPALGHLTPKIEFAKRLLDRDDRFSITVLIMRPGPVPDAILAHVESLAASDTRIKFINLPRSVDHNPLMELPKSADKLFSDLLEAQKPYVKEAIIKHVISNPNSAPLAGLVVDFFCTSMIDVANELGVPSYLFFPSTAAYLGLLLSLLDRHDQGGREFEDIEADYVFKSYVPPIPSRVLPIFTFNKYGGYATRVNHTRRFKETKGIILNSFAELESHAVNFLLNDDDIPPVYAVGPVIGLESERQLSLEEARCHEIMKWLDDQPDSSVVFLCFGSRGSFREEQVKEIASGLEQSGVRFLWSLRRPPPKGKLATPSEYTSDLQEVLPHGFMERTKQMGMVCGWAPQKAVLAHKSVGGFVSHCGWNSVLESLWFGVPIATWPMYAEQQINAFQLVKDLGLAVELKMDYRDTSGEIVSAEEIARAIKSVMESDSTVTKRVKQVSENARSAVTEGSSFSALGLLLEDITKNMA